MKFITLVSSLSAVGTRHLVAAHGGHVDGLHSSIINAASSSVSNTTSILLDKAIKALGGEAALNDIKTYQASAFIYRTQTLAESELPGLADLATAIRGEETVTYDLSNDGIVQRVDRSYHLSNWLYFAKPLSDSDSIDAAFVVREGSAGYACYVKGNEDAYLPADQPWGYLDASLTRVLVREAVRQSPKLLLSVAQHPNSTVATTLPFQGVNFPAVVDSRLCLAILFDPDSFLPYVVRAYEDHAIYGRSTNDLLLYNYTTVGNIQVPLHIKVIYNQEHPLVDTWYAPPAINPSIEAGFFDPVPTSSINQTASKLPPTPANDSTGYGDAEVFELSQNLLWTNGYTGTLPNLTVTQPLASLPNLHHLVFRDAPGYATLVADFGAAVMAVDAPAHQSPLVIRWIREALGKEPTHLLVTHHHHDHTYGAADFVAAGAALVVPEEFRGYWSSIPGVRFATATEEQPFAYRNAEMQVRGVWHRRAAHASDWMYFAWTVACPTASDRMAISVADAWSPGFPNDIFFDHGEALQLVDVLRADRAQRDSLVIPIHGVPTNTTELYELTGASYPEFRTTDFLPGGPWCWEDGAASK